MNMQQALETVATKERRSILGRNRVRGKLGAYKAAAYFDCAPLDDSAQVARDHDDARSGSERLLERILRYYERRAGQ